VDCVGIRSDILCRGYTVADRENVAEESSEPGEMNKRNGGQSGGSRLDRSSGIRLCGKLITREGKLGDKLDELDVLT
jgi:hypothetical protein